MNDPPLDEFLRGFDLERLEVPGDGDCLLHSVGVFSENIRSMSTDQARIRMKEHMVQHRHTMFEPPQGCGPQPSYDEWVQFIYARAEVGEESTEEQQNTRWGKYLGSISTPQTYMDELAALVIARTFGVHIHIICHTGPLDRMQFSCSPVLYANGQDPGTKEHALILYEESYQHFSALCPKLIRIPGGSPVRIPTFKNLRTKDDILASNVRFLAINTNSKDNLCLKDKYAEIKVWVMNKNVNNNNTTRETHHGTHAQNNNGNVLAKQGGGAMVGVHGGQSGASFATPSTSGKRDEWVVVHGKKQRTPPALTNSEGPIHMDHKKARRGTPTRLHSEFLQVNVMQSSSTEDNTAMEQAYTYADIVMNTQSQLNTVIDTNISTTHSPDQSYWPMKLPHIVNPGRILTFDCKTSKTPQQDTARCDQTGGNSSSFSKKEPVQQQKRCNSKKYRKNKSNYTNFKGKYPNNKASTYDNGAADAQKGKNTVSQCTAHKQQASDDSLNGECQKNQGKNDHVSGNTRSKGKNEKLELN